MTDALDALDESENPQEPRGAEHPHEAHRVTYLGHWEGCLRTTESACYQCGQRTSGDGTMS